MILQASMMPDTGSDNVVSVDAEVDSRTRQRAGHWTAPGAKLAG